MPRTNAGFSTLEVVKATGITQRCVAYWSATDLITPSVFNRSGQGHHRRFSIPDVLAFAALGRMRAHGLSLQALREVGNFLRSRDGSEFQDVHRKLCYAPGSRRYPHDIALLTDEEIISLLKEPGQSVCPAVVDTEELFREIRERLNEIHDARPTVAAAKKKRRAEHKRERSAPDQRLERVA